jgi:hypothetical protein
MRATVLRFLAAAGVLAGAAIATTAATSTAYAEEVPPPIDDPGPDAPELLRAGSHPMFVEAGLGPSIFMGASGNGGSAEGGFTQFKLWQEFGYHFSGTASGPAIGVNVEEAFVQSFRFQPGVKAWWDIPVGDFGLYLTPSAKLGYSGTFVEGGAAHHFNIHAGFRGKLLLGDTGSVFFQPIGVDMLAGDMGFGAFWDLMLGGGFIFG